ncbi:MAG TPA: cytochrome c [Xanthobacteraceae bacterium]
MRYAWLMAIAFAAGPAFAQPAADKLDDTQRLGQRLFNQSCRVCHAKPQFNSAQYGPVLSQDSLGGDARALRETISNGTPRMPGFRINFQPAQIDAIVAYLKTVPSPAASNAAPAPGAAPARARGGADAD